MCGIAGIVDFNSSPIPRQLRQMTDQIIHRGPDSGGEYLDSKAALGIRRLSIIDLVSGDQPIKNETGNIVIVFNGEIYNFKTLRNELLADGHIFKTQSDTEVLVHLYEKYGEKMLSRLNGMFAFAIWDKNKESLLLGRDHAGIKPLYFWHTSKKLVFGSEVKTILISPGFKKRLNKSAFQLYTAYGYIGGHQSIFENVQKLPPGHYAIFSKSKLRIESYYSPSPKTNDETDLDALFNDSVGLQSFADVPLGILLSGGLDSSLVAYYLVKHKRNVNSFSIGFAESEMDESGPAKLVAKNLGTNHHADTFSPQDLIDIFPKIQEQLDEPLADPSLFPTFKVCQFARKYVKVALSGDGGDELFGGYPTYQGHIWAKQMALLPRFLKSFLVTLPRFLPGSMRYGNYVLKDVVHAFATGLDLPPARRHLKWMNQFFIGNNDQNNFSDLISYLDLPKEIDNEDLIREMQILDFKTYLPDDLLVKSDRASMYNSLEVRVPFLDPRIVNYAYTKGRKHVDIFTTKKIIRSLLKDKLPVEILNRKKKGFGIPLQKWISSSLYDLTRHYLNYPPLLKFFPNKKIAQMFEETCSGAANHAKQIWMRVMFSSWLEKWGDFDLDLNSKT